ncbi:cobalt ECF transporter T component CbiQ [Romboutsia sp.]|uniref:cobalt ECF transporter T component CbiQ n=1 Tax=Romboutsia sp. TaxID=1965302 RepID=UPI003F3298E3
MSSFTDSIYKIRSFEELGEKQTIVHTIHPLAKLIITIAYIVSIVSFSKYEIGGILPFILYPIVVFYLGDVPFKATFKMSLLGLPFILGIGIFNPIFDRTVAFSILNLNITGGWISFVSLLIKGILTIMCGLLFVSTTGIENISKALRMIGVPKIITMQFVLTYRYICVLLESVGEVYNAYMLRAPGQKGINFKVWGSLIGQLLIRSFERAERIHNAMVLRGFEGDFNSTRVESIKSKDIIYILIWVSFFIIARNINIPLFIGSLITG